MRAFLTRVVARWYSAETPPLWLRALAALFGFVAGLRRRRLQRRARLQRLPVPVIVVGNVTLGGTGKTPLVIWLVERLREWGWKPGVISRGYGGRVTKSPQRVLPAAEPADVGDEPVLIARRTRCTVVVGPDRVAAAERLLAQGGVDIVISDDGLQHYALHRDLEIAVVDAARGLGNGYLLPAGPLREPAARLREVDLVVSNGSGWTAPEGRTAVMRLQATLAQRLDGSGQQPLSHFAGQTVHAVAGIGNPARFFSLLSKHDIRLVMHPFPDHHAFRREDLEFGDELPVLMTEKDAVKCRAFAAPRHWFVPVEAAFAAADAALVQELVQRLRH